MGEACGASVAAGVSAKSVVALSSKGATPASQPEAIRIIASAETTSSAKMFFFIKNLRFSPRILDGPSTAEMICLSPARTVRAIRLAGANSPYSGLLI
jgi:hypothetical protein